MYDRGYECELNAEQRALYESFKAARQRGEGPRERRREESVYVRERVRFIPPSVHNGGSHG